MTDQAEQTAKSDLGMPRHLVFAVVAALKATEFYKTMQSEQNPGLWQDVYRTSVTCPKYPSGVTVYCKVQLVHGGLTVVVISFKKL